MVGCSKSSIDEETSFQEPNSSTSTMRGPKTIEVGVVDSDGNYVVTMDVSEIKKLWEDQLAKTDIVVNYTDFVIEERIAVNDPTSVDYLLVGYDAANSISTATSVNKFDLSFQVIEQSDFEKTITCSGCQYGCNIQTFKKSGKIYKICGAGCGSDCRKTETETY